MHIHFIYLGIQTQSYMDCNVFEHVKNGMYFSHIFEPAVTHTPYIQRSTLKRIRSYAYSHRLLYKWIMHGKSPFITPDHQHSTKLKQIDIFGDNNRVNSSNFNATILKFSEKFDHPFSHVFIFGNLFPESHGFVAMPVTSHIKDICSNLSLSN